MRDLLEFDDAGAADDEPVKGVTVGDIRAWHDRQEFVATKWQDAMDKWEECLNKIDQMHDALGNLIGLCDLVSGRDDIPREIWNALNCNWRRTEANAVYMTTKPRAGAEPATGSADHDGEALGRTADSISATGAKSREWKCSWCGCSLLLSPPYSAEPVASSEARISSPGAYLADGTKIKPPAVLHPYYGQPGDDSPDEDPSGQRRETMAPDPMDDEEPFPAASPFPAGDRQ